MRNRVWTICQSSVHQSVPPSQWQADTYKKLCFTRHDTPPFPTNAHTAPGTALFQHWIRQHQNETFPSAGASSSDSWDPWNDFPTEDFLTQYPDIGDGDDDANTYARDYYTLWYTTTVYVPEADNLRGHLTLHGVNYHPTVYFDGKKLQTYTVYSEDDDNDNHDTGGMFIRRHYDLGLSNKRSSSSPPLEILVSPPPFVGSPCKDACTTNDCQGGDHYIAKSGAIMQCSSGWDWISPTPDRNVGIWDKVEVEWVSGDVKLHDVWVKILKIVVDSNETEYNDHDTSSLPLPLGDDVTVSAWIDLRVTTTFHGLIRRPILEGDISYWITPYSVSSSLPEQIIEASAILASGTIYNVTIEQLVTDYHLGKIHIPKGKLWWPHTHGSQPLYSVRVVFRSTNNNAHESSANARFGLRTVSSETGIASKSFTLKINGHPIYLVGGNWITTDQFLRFSNSFQRYFNELTLLANAGFNSIRVWGGGITETRQFYHAADEIGLLIYQEFWMTGDNNGRFAGEYDWPNDHVTYTKNVRDVVRRLRNHPSLAMFGGGNELFPIEKSPPKDIKDFLQKYISELDGTRPYLISSVTEVGANFEPTQSLGPKDGPYGIQREENFFDRNPGFSSPLISLEEQSLNVSRHDIKNKNAAGRNIGFQAEIGSVSHPELESLKRFLSSDALSSSFPSCGVTSCFDINHEWAYWKWLPFTENSSLVDHICQFQYPPLNNLTSESRMSSVEDYIWAAQFAQYIQYHTLMQGYSHRIFDWHSGFFVWKTSSPSPTLRGSLYDWYLATNGGYWGSHAGLSGGSPIRIVFNRRDWTLVLVNTLPKTFVDVVIKWAAHSLNGTYVGGDNIISGQLSGNHATNIEYSVPWIESGEPPLVPELQRQYKSKHSWHSMFQSDGMTNILLYRMEIFYKEVTSSAINKARNDYYLTDPCDRGHRRQSRYALLGAFRKVVPRVRIDVACIADDLMNIECTAVHSQKDTVAMMTRFVLVLDPNMSDGSDNRILPSFFSENYINLLPGESSNINIKTTNYQKETWTCLPDGYVGVGTSKNGGFFLMVSVDGWNIEDKTVLIGCNRLTRNG